MIYSFTNPVFYINLLTCTMFLDSYADDTIFHASDPSIDNLTFKTHQDINTISLWRQHHGIKINIDKPHFLITKSDNTQVNLTVDNTSLVQTINHSFWFH